jgi:hypothetical protein
MTELSFLLELLLEHELKKDTQKLIRERIKEIEARPTAVHAQAPRPAQGNQAPSTQKLLDEMAQATGSPVPQMAAQIPNPSTNAAAQALMHRAELIAQAVSGKEEKGRSSPRKF